MRKSVLRWLLQRSIPRHKPLAMRTSWYDFAGRMRKAIGIDVSVLLGEVSLAELRRQHITRPLDAYSAETLANPPQSWWYERDTMTDDPGRTKTMEVIVAE